MEKGGVIWSSWDCFLHIQINQIRQTNEEIVRETKGSVGVGE